MKFLRILVCLGAISLLLSACGPLLQKPAPINNLDQVDHSVYEVQSGDNLAYIAHKYHMSVDDLIRINHLSSPYRLRTGQRLTVLSPTGQSAVAQPLQIQKPQVGSRAEFNHQLDQVDKRPYQVSETSGEVKVALPHHKKPQVVQKKQSSLDAHHKKHHHAKTPEAPKVKPKKVVVAQPKPVLKTKPKLPVIQPKAVTSQPTVKTISTGFAWQWPVKGQVSDGFSAMHPGLDIKAKLGQAISAAASGEVIFSGQGVTGYGNLIIIKHPKDILTVYAHNQKLLVKVGDQVKKGRKIATVGTNNGQPALYFEVRSGGQSVNPLAYLPKA